MERLHLLNTKLYFVIADVFNEFNSRLLICVQDKQVYEQRLKQIKKITDSSPIPITLNYGEIEKVYVLKSNNENFDQCCLFGSRVLDVKSPIRFYHAFLYDEKTIFESDINYKDYLQLELRRVLSTEHLDKTYSPLNDYYTLVSNLRNIGLEEFILIREYDDGESQIDLSIQEFEKRICVK